MIFKPCSNCRSISKWILQKEHLTVSPGLSIDPSQLCSALELPFLCKCFWILFTLNILSAHLLPFKTSATVLEGWVSSSCRERPVHPCVVLLQLLTEAGMLLWHWHWAAAAPLKAHLEASQGEAKQRPVTTQLHTKNRSICNVAILTLREKPY